MMRDDENLYRTPVTFVEDIHADAIEASEGEVIFELEEAEFLRLGLHKTNAAYRGDTTVRIEYRLPGKSEVHYMQVVLGDLEDAVAKLREQFDRLKPDIPE